MTKQATGVVVLMLFVATTTLAQTAMTVTCSSNAGINCPAAIPDRFLDLDGLLASQQLFPGTFCIGAMDFIAAVDVHVDITHSHVGDLTIGTSTVPGNSILVDQLGSGACSGSDIDATFSNRGAVPTCQNMPAIGPGLIAPVTSLLNNPYGNWVLVITDHQVGGTGVLNDWSITAYCGKHPTVTVTAVNGVAVEGGVSLIFRVMRSALSVNPALPSEPLLVNIDINADAADYVPLSPVIIPADQLFVDFVVTPVVDGLTEGPETVTAIVQSGSGYFVGQPNTATGQIMDPNGIPTLSPFGLALMAMLLLLAGYLLLREG